MMSKVELRLPWTPGAKLIKRTRAFGLLLFLAPSCRRQLSLHEQLMSRHMSARSLLKDSLALPSLLLRRLSYRHFVSVN